MEKPIKNKLEENEECEEPPDHSINSILVKGGRKRKDCARSNLDYSKVVTMSQANQCGVLVHFMLISGILTSGRKGTTLKNLLCSITSWQRPTGKCDW